MDMCIMLSVSEAECTDAKTAKIERRWSGVHLSSRYVQSNHTLSDNLNLRDFLKPVSNKLKELWELVSIASVVL